MTRAVVRRRRLSNPSGVVDNQGKDETKPVTPPVVSPEARAAAEEHYSQV